MSEDKAMTVGDVKRAIKDLPDDMPVCIYDEHDYTYCLSLQQESIAFYNSDLDDDIEVDCFVVGMT